MELVASASEAKWDAGGSNSKCRVSGRHPQWSQLWRNPRTAPDVVVVVAARGAGSSEVGQMAKVGDLCKTAEPDMASVRAHPQLELRRGATTMTITWPVASAGDCALWMRELLR